MRGDKLFRDAAQKKSKSLGKEIDKKGLKYPIPLPQIIQAVANQYQITVVDIKRAKRGKRNRNIPRWIAMKLCQEVGSAKLAEIAALFNVGHYSTVSQTIGRLNHLIDGSNQYKDEYNMLSQDLTP